MGNKRVHITLIIEGADGTREVSAECSETVAFALYMLQLVPLMPARKDGPPDQVQFRAAANAYLTAAERLRVAGKKLRKTGRKDATV